ncbi:tyrosine-type recombinase/integrase [Clostridium sp. OS1-26]|uniref:tyrosine-type recombinase/integrase n=1 Tax=Clostridium sp. OS1-26 TaxID=3070681 RepID=UPI0035A8B34C
MHTWLFEIVRLKVKPSSFQKYEGIYRNYISECELYGLKISNLKYIQIQRYYNKLFDNSISSNVIKNLNKLLKQFLNYAVDEGYLLKNPISGKKIVIPSEKDVTDTKEVEIFTNDEIDSLKKVLEGHRLKSLILIALGTGLKQGELLALKWEDIDINNNMKLKSRKLENDGSRKTEVILQPPKSKNSNRTVPIPSSLIPIIKEH